jgi:hypothetical protein
MSKWTLGQLGKNKAKQTQSNPNKAKTNPILANKTPEQTQYKPKHTQFQRKMMLLPMLITGRYGPFDYCVDLNVVDKRTCILSVNIVTITKYSQGNKPLLTIVARNSMKEHTNA